VRRRALALTGLALALSLGGCATTVRRSMPPASGAWINALGTAKEAVADGRYSDADRTLQDFILAYVGADEAREAAYWRALFTLDPANRGGDTRSAEKQLDDYLSDTASTLHRTEAVTLRRLAATIDSLGRTHRISMSSSDAARAEQAELADQREAELQKEIQRLKEQLEKTTAELERIKKRLSEKNPQ
jgi:ribosomal protein S6